MGAIRRLATHPQIAFLVLNVAVNLLFIARSYVTMLVLDYAALGLVALVQSIILLVGMMQFGLVNGGYRLLCSAKEPGEAQRINDAFYSGLAVLAVLAIAGGAFAVLWYDTFAYRIAGAIGAVGGLAALVRSWMMNEMLAESRLGDYNRINVISAALSLCFLLFIPYDALLACLAAVLMQHVLFVLFALLARKATVPRQFRFEPELFRAIFRAGFVLFLTGVFLQLNLQIERWYVVATLGLDDLGHLYLAILFLTLFQLVPNSLNAMFLPPLVRANDAGDHAATRRGMAKMALSTLAYCALTALLVYTVAEPLVALVLPGYVGDLAYVEILLPGLLLFTLASAFAMPFNVLIRYRYYIIGYASGSVLLVALFTAALAAGTQLDLTQVVAVRSLSYAAMGAVLAFGFWRIVRGHKQFVPSLPTR